MEYPSRAERIVSQAVRKAPATISKQNRGHPAKRKSFKIWTVTELLERHRDPRDVLLEIASMDTRKLAHLLSGETVDEAGKPIITAAAIADAIAERRLCAQAALPYLCQKMPVQVDMKHSSRAIHLNLLTEREFQDVVDLANADDTASSSLQMLNGIAAESSTDDHQQPDKSTLLIRDGVTAWPSSERTNADATVNNGKDAHANADARQGDETGVSHPVARPVPEGSEQAWLGSESSWWDAAERRREKARK